MNATQSPEPSGKGVTNGLFRAQSQAEGTSEHLLFEAVRDRFSRITEGHRFHVQLETDNQLHVYFQPPGSKSWLSADRCGLGLQDVLVILWFAVATGFGVVGIEEPENHLHPGWQRRLLAELRSIDEKRFILTTHSNVFLDNALVDRIVMTSMEDGRIRVQDVTSRASALDDLGYSVSDNLVSDMVVLVEGPSDVRVLEELFKKRGILQKYAIRFWPLGGDIMDQLDLEVFAEGYSIRALVDKDPGSSKVRRRFAAKCKKHGIPVHVLSRTAIENYFDVDALRAVFGKQVPAEMTNVDPRTKLDTQLGFDPKSKNRYIARHLDWEAVRDTDLGRFVLSIEEDLEARS